MQAYVLNDRLGKPDMKLILLPSNTGHFTNKNILTKSNFLENGYRFRGIPSDNNRISPVTIYQEGDISVSVKR